MDRGSCITQMDLEYMLCDEMAEPKALPLSLLEEITNGFSDEEKIGSGAFAVVYKGKLENMIVAVKKMSNSYMHEKEFQREVECLMMVKHKNVVRFLGYCADTQGTMARHEGKLIMADVQQRLLCFEYLPKGSLREYITDTTSGLQWRDRYRIIKGISQGLHYLHEKNIVHLDLKPENILLDGTLVAKIADFGLSRCFDEMQSRAITAKIGGTLGYLAPEFGNGEITYQFDIYSLGVIIIEILTGKKGYQEVDEVVERWSTVLDNSRSKVQQDQVRVCAEIGIQCTDFNPAKRPATQHIINRLDEVESMNEYIETGMITSEQINPDWLVGTMHSLWLRYQQLNLDIRRCIEYCSIFPKGSKLKIVELVRMWISQGFIKTSLATKDVEDLAQGYIQELVSCSFLQPIETSSDNDIIVGTSSDNDYLTVDDVLHDILDKVAQNCSRIENLSSQRGEGWEGDVPQDVQHLLLQKYDAKLITEKIIGLKQLRTLIVYFVEEDTQVEEKVIERVCMLLPELRLLAVAVSREQNPIKQKTFSIPESISELKHLCYLAFRTNRTCKVTLPSSLNKLQRIQVLDFGDGHILEFSFFELMNLRHIICSFANFRNIGRLVSLQTIPVFTAKNERGYELTQMRGLNKLGGRLKIYGLENVTTRDEALEANLAAKERLTELNLSWEGHGDDTDVQAEVLEGLCPPMGLQTLCIAGYKGSRYPDWMVGKQNELHKLSLWTCSQLGVPAPGFVEAFIHLRVLDLSYCGWDALPGNMERLTSLRALILERCLNIRSLPTLPRSLVEFCVGHCDDEFMKSCQTVGDPNWQKIEHIPEKLFY